MTQPPPLGIESTLDGQDGEVQGLWVLVVEEPGRVTHSLVRLLRERMSVHVARDPVVPYVLAFEGVFDAIILHRRVEGPDGSITLCRNLRRGGVTTPILILAQRASVDDIVGGIEVGADDVMIEPVNADLVAARLRSFWRRKTT